MTGKGWTWAARARTGPRRAAWKAWTATRSTEVVGRPARGYPASGCRAYPAEATGRVRFIRRAQRLGFSLREIKDRTECDKHQDEHCRRCAEACRRCSAECRKLAA